MTVSKLRNIPILRALFWLCGSLVAYCLLHGFLVVSTLAAPAPKPSDKVTKKDLPRYQRYGDVSFRFSAGPQLYQLTTASGELLSSTIGERAFALHLIPEYTYHFLPRTSFFITLPLEVDVDLLVGTTVGFGIGVGLRQYFGPYVFADAQLLLYFVRRSLGRLEFGGIAISLGLSIPLGERVALLITAQAPFNFIDGFLFSVRGYLGFETFF